MITSKITILAIPQVVWDAKTQFGDYQIDLKEFAQDALAIERRIVKGVNLDNERNRYTLCCSRLEAAVKIPILQYIPDETGFVNALSQGFLPAFTLETDYLNMLETILQEATPNIESARLGASFHPPKSLLIHARNFFETAAKCQLENNLTIQARLNFLHWAVNSKCGVIEIDDPYTWREENNEIPAANRLYVSTNDENEKALDFGESEDLDDDDLVDNTGRSAYLILREQVMHALQCARVGQPAEVNFSNQPHEVITEVLREFINTDNSLFSEPVYIQVVYTDGSRGRPFPLVCIPEKGEYVTDLFLGVEPLKAALLSMRHLALDRDVDMAWFRNREVSKARSFGETDEFCYQQSLRQLRDARSEGTLNLHIYQTGLQPAVIGLYRAVVEEIIERKGTNFPLKVVPFFFRKSGHYAQGEPWF